MKPPTGCLAKILSVSAVAAMLLIAALGVIVRRDVNLRVLRQNGLSTTLAFAAVTVRSDSLAIRLGEHSRNLDARDAYNFTLLAHAANEGRLVVVRALIKYRADPNAMVGRGALKHTPLSLSAPRYPAIVSALLDGGADPRDRSGVASPIGTAAAEGNGASLLLLLRAGGNPNGAYPGRTTALMWAAQLADAESVQQLLEHGADPDLKDASGRTALQLTTSPRVREIIQRYSRRAH